MSDPNTLMPFENKQPTLRVWPTRADSNAKGDIFGGWVMSKMDIAGAIAAYEVVKTTLSTVAVKDLQFLHPLFADDKVHIFTEVMKVGNTSITMQVDVCTVNQDQQGKIHLCHIATGIFVYVSVSAPGKKQSIQITPAGQ